MKINQLAMSAAVMVTVMFPGLVSAQGSITRPNVATAVGQLKTTVANDKVSKLQTKALAEIDRRLAMLNEVLSKLNNLDTISVESKGALVAEVTQAITDLTTLRTQVGSATDLTALRTSVKSISDGYKNFGMLHPRLQLIIAADKQLARIEALMDIVTKLQAQAAGMGGNSADASRVTKSLDAAQTQLVAMKDKTGKVLDGLLAMKVGSASANRSSLQSARQTLVSNNTELAKMIGTIKAGLAVWKAMGGKEATGAGMMKSSK